MEPARRWHSLFRIEAFSARNPLGIESDFRSSLASTNNMAEFFKKCIECGERGVASVSYSLFDINGTLQRSEYEFGPETSDAGCAERNSHARTHQGETRDYIVRFMDGVQLHAVAPQHSRDRVVKTGSHTPGKNYNLLLVQRSRRDLFEARECMTSWHRQPQGLLSDGFKNKIWLINRQIEETHLDSSFSQCLDLDTGGHVLEYDSHCRITTGHSRQCIDKNSVDSSGHSYRKLTDFTICSQ